MTNDPESLWLTKIKVHFSDQRESVRQGQGLFNHIVLRSSVAPEFSIEVSPFGGAEKRGLMGNHRG